MPQALTTTKYSTLLNDITTIYTRSRRRAKRALDRILTEAYWEIGKRIVTVEQDNQIRAEYGKRLLEHLSEDLTKKHGNGFSYRNINYMRQFYIANPILQPAAELGWTKHCILLSIDNDKLRKQYEQKVAREKWSKRKLIAELKKDQAVRQEAQAPTKPRRRVALHDTRGTIGVYRVVVPQGIQVKKEKPCLDLGFDIYQEEVPGLARCKHGDIVESIGGERVRKSPKRNKNDLYMFKAKTGKVVDGDTVWVYVHCGFGLTARRKLRLRGINTPEAGTKEGRIAKGFLKRTLDTVEFIVIKTHGTGKFGRYVADIFYLPGESDADAVARDGILLNQEMLDGGLASLYMGEG